jgi:hypothetical protein
MAQRDPHDVLEVPRDAGPAAVKAAWRRLAREHHPDLAADSAARLEATRRMAEINAAYEQLRSRPAARAGSPGPDAAAPGARARAQAAARPTGPPPPPPTRPVTARLDTTDLYRPRNATTTPAGGGYRYRPRSPSRLRRATWTQAEEPRASEPTGPLQRVRARRVAGRRLPDLATALAMQIAFGKFHGRTLAEIAALEPAYLAWVERTITRDPDLVAAARVVLDQRERDAASDDAADGPSGAGADSSEVRAGLAGDAGGDAERRPHGPTEGASAGYAADG